MPEPTVNTVAPNIATLKGRFIIVCIWIVCALGAFVALTWMLLAALVGSNRGWSLARAFDRVVNAATGGSDTETISSRANRLKATTGWACVLCKVLDKIEPNHCENSAGV